MSMNLTQPEEVEQILKSMAWENQNLQIPSGDKDPSKYTWKQSAPDTYLAPYRAIKIHLFSDKQP